LKNLGQVGLVHLMAVVLFARLAALMLGDMPENVSADVPLPANLGFVTFRNFLYTAFVAQTTGNLPAAMIPSFMANRWFIIVWFMYFVSAVCIIAQVILAVVYTNFESETSTLKSKHQRNLGTQQAFNWLQTDGRVSEQDLAKTCEVLPATGAFRVDEDFMHCIADSFVDGHLGDTEILFVLQKYVQEQTPPIKAINSFCTNAKERVANEGYSEQVDKSYFLWSLSLR